MVVDWETVVVAEDLLRTIERCGNKANLARRKIEVFQACEEEGRVQQ